MVAPEYKTPQFLHGFAREVVKALGEGWTYSKEDNLRSGELTSWADIKGPSGETVILSLDAYRGRITAKPQIRAYENGLCVAETPYNFTPIERGCAATSTPASLAKAMRTHGVLDNALEAHKHLQVALAERTAGLNAQASAIALLRTIPGLDVREPQNSARDATVYFEGGSATITNYGSVRMELYSMDGPTAARVLRALLAVEE